MQPNVDSTAAIDFFYNFVKFCQVVIFLFGAYQFWANRRERLAADKIGEAQATLDSNLQAWQVVNSAQGKGGSGGRLEALGVLVRNGQSLAGVNLDGAWLEGVDLRGAMLAHASLRNVNLQGARLDGANLKNAVLDGANLTAVQFTSAVLQGASVAGTRLSAANFREADLAELRGWQEIQSITYAQLHGVLRAPPGFRQWARDHGAEDAKTDEAEPDDALSYSTQFKAV
jgi:hypothetical protein